LQEVQPIESVKFSILNGFFDFAGSQTVSQEYEVGCISCGSSTVFPTHSFTIFWISFLGLLSLHEAHHSGRRMIPVIK